MLYLGNSAISNALRLSLQISESLLIPILVFHSVSQSVILPKLSTRIFVRSKIEIGICLPLKFKRKCQSMIYLEILNKCRVKFLILFASSVNYRLAIFIYLLLHQSVLPQLKYCEDQQIHFQTYFFDNIRNTYVFFVFLNNKNYSSLILHKQRMHNFADIFSTCKLHLCTLM